MHLESIFMDKKIDEVSNRYLEVLNLNGLILIQMRKLWLASISILLRSLNFFWLNFEWSWLNFFSLQLTLMFNVWRMMKMIGLQRLQNAKNTIKKDSRKIQPDYWINKLQAYPQTPISSPFLKMLYAWFMTYLKFKHICTKNWPDWFWYHRQKKNWSLSRSARKK